ncbi:Hemolysin, contains CBS domains [Raineyella antarctica]|uniref:Hemolysin, contains CBS domains n=1 Tax=Raineyella antarctica TaxID=1577474 RepID=A0A1G6GZT4_9ACTN|nr:hemolysin family protein [Raineyella antarctica]SDB86626.1 Hemolysin, contains CBS domains [Raineyella antarctica]
MSQPDIIQLVVAAVLAIAAGIFSAIDAAFQSFSHARAENLVEEGVPGAKRLELITQDPAPTLNAVLFVSTILQVTSIVLVTRVVLDVDLRNWVQLLVSIGAMVVVSFIAWGVAPRTLGRQRADGVATRTSGLVSVLTTFLGPIPQILIWIGNALTPGRGFDDGPFSSEAELRELVDKAEQSDLIEAGERAMIHSVFELGDTMVKEVMVPRTDIVSIEDTKTLRQATSLALRSGFSRIPVVGEGGLDNVLGVVFLKDLMKRMYDNPQSQTTERVSSLMRPPTWCPDSKPVDDLLREMQTTHSHMVMVVDEFGGTAGLATIEDILEEIVGEIIDEYDAGEVAPITELSEGRYRVSARLAVDELGELFGRRLDDDDVDTVGGLMAKLLNVVPIAGSVVRWEGLELVAERGQGRRSQIETILVTQVGDDEEAGDDRATSAVLRATENGGGK